MPTQSGYDLDYQVSLAMGLMHQATIDATPLDCVFARPTIDDLDFSANAATLMVATRDIEGDNAKLIVLDKHSVVTNVQAPGVDPLAWYLVKDRQKGSAGKTKLILERQS